MSEPNKKKAFFLFVLCVVVGLNGCGGDGPEGETTAAATTPGGVLILVLGDVGAGDDTARAAQEVFGGPSSVIFERHYTASTKTAGALLSILSGYPASALDVGDEEEGLRPTLSELFVRMNYYTFGVVGGDPSLLGSGIERGFDDYRFDAAASNDELIAAVLEAIGRAPGEYLGLVSLANADPTAVAKFATAMQGIGGFENTLFVVTADHGPDEGAGDSQFVRQIGNVFPIERDVESGVFVSAG